MLYFWIYDRMQSNASGTAVAPTLEAMEPASLHALLETCEMSKP